MIYLKKESKSGVDVVAQHANVGLIILMAIFI
jgi:hypothetical protein